MAIDVLAAVGCGNSYQHELTRPPPAVAFLRDQKLSNWWTPRCQDCYDHLDGHDYEAIVIPRPSWSVSIADDA